MSSTNTIEKEFYLVGFETRTDNASETSDKGEIGKLWERIYVENLKSKIEKIISEEVYAVYSNYESDENGKYDFFIGYKVENLDQVPEGLVGKIIVSGPYQKFETNQGNPYQVVPETWVKIWEELRGKRAFKTDFEVYGEKCQDPSNSIVDIYVGINE